MVLGTQLRRRVRIEAPILYDSASPGANQAGKRAAGPVVVLGTRPPGGVVVLGTRSEAHVVSGARPDPVVVSGTDRRPSAIVVLGTTPPG